MTCPSDNGKMILYLYYETDVIVYFILESHINGKLVSRSPL